MTKTATATKPVARIVADYQMMGEMEGHEWAHLVLGEAKKNGTILDYEVLGAYQGQWGIWHVVFTVDVDWGTHGLEVHMTHRALKEPARALLNGPVIQDSDVQVRWICSAEVSA